MDQNFQGDLTDILRASGSTSNSNTSDYQEPLRLSVEPKPINNNWQFTSSTDHHHHHHDHMMSNFPPSLMEEEDHQTLLVPGDIFGDPFSHARDPLHHHINISGSGFFDEAEPGFFIPPPAPPPPLPPQPPSQQASVDLDVKFNPTCNIFSRMLQINPSTSGSGAATKAEVSSRCDSPRGLIGKPGDALIGASIGGAAAGAGGGGMQISTPRNPGSGIKRRKSQAKKVVCIPAPAAANSRASGEVVPSDLWAWRKYGQKPIKGSPYPRGYYRCSSSKGCSARKQVERSRTDPNMLVITYTSEHNHPWPTQRNALAGSTRSQPAKSNNNSNSSNNNAISLKNSPIDQLQKNMTSPKEEQPKPESNNNNNIIATTTSTTSASVKEENTEKNNDIEKRLESLDDSAFSSGSTGHEAGFGYRPALMSNVNNHDFFAELGEIEANNPMSLLFSQGFSSSTDHQNQHKELVAGSNNETKALLDHTFSLFDWSEGNNNNNNNKPQ